MSELGKRQMRAGTRPSQNGTEGSPLRVFMLGAVVIVVLIAALLITIRLFLFPIWEANSEGARQVATAQVQLSAAMTREALTPRPTATAEPTAILVAAASTLVPTELPTAAPQASTAPSESTVIQTPTPNTGVLPTDLPTPTADQAAEVATAYKEVLRRSFRSTLRPRSNTA